MNCVCIVLFSVGLKLAGRMGGFTRLFYDDSFVGRTESSC